MNCKEYGWNGFAFEVPEDMRFTKEGGNSEKGNLRFEAENFFLELQWEPFAPKKAKPLAELVDNFIRTTRKSKKRRLNILRKDKAEVFGHNSIYLSMKSQFDERLYMWYCEESKRITSCHFAFKILDDETKKIMKQTIETLKCHGEKANVWSLMNVRFQIPPSFLLNTRKITVGRAHFSFVEKKATPFAENYREILVEYFGMANVLFEDTYRDLDKWFQQNYMKDLKKRYKQVSFPSQESRKFRRHNMILKQGKVTAGLASMTSRKTAIRTNATWYCSGSNRIYSVTYSASISRPLFFKRVVDVEGYKSLIQKTLSSFECH